jgi:uncharacterized protein YuzE
MKAKYFQDTDTLYLVHRSLSACAFDFDKIELAV